MTVFRRVEATVTAAVGRGLAAAAAPPFRPEVQSRPDCLSEPPPPPPIPQHEPPHTFSGRMASDPVASTA